ncbi:unnamed protein product, partial [Ectocarpus sp. 4 AP-2014]
PWVTIPEVNHDNEIPTLSKNIQPPPPPSSAHASVAQKHSRVRLFDAEACRFSRRFSRLPFTVLPSGHDKKTRDGGWMGKNSSTNIPPRSACSIAHNMPSFSGRNGPSTTISTPIIIPKPSTNQPPRQTRHMHREAHTKLSKTKHFPPQHGKQLGGGVPCVLSVVFIHKLAALSTRAPTRTQARESGNDKSSSILSSTGQKNPFHPKKICKNNNHAAAAAAADASARDRRPGCPASFPLQVPGYKLSTGMHAATSNQFAPFFLGQTPLLTIKNSTHDDEQK